MLAISVPLPSLTNVVVLGDRFFFIKDGVICHAGGSEIIRESVIREIFDADVRIVEIEGKKIIINGGE